MSIKIGTVVVYKKADWVVSRYSKIDKLYTLERFERKDDVWSRCVVQDIPKNEIEKRS